MSNVERDRYALEGAGDAIDEDGRIGRRQREIGYQHREKAEELLRGTVDASGQAHLSGEAAGVGLNRDIQNDWRPTKIIWRKTDSKGGAIGGGPGRQNERVIGNW